MMSDVPLIGSGAAHSIAPGASHPTGAHGVLSGLAGFGRTIGARARSALFAVQMGQMRSVLTKMNDYQLSQIGIQRSDIPDYAKRLMEEERKTGA